MKSIVAEQATPADLKKYGFDKPQGTVTLHAGGASTSLVFGGNANEPTSTCAMRRSRSSPPPTASLLDELRKAPEDYRRKERFRVPPILHRSARVHARRADGRAREGQIAGLTRQVASAQSDRRRAGRDEHGRSAHETRGPPGSTFSTRRPEPAWTSRRSPSTRNSRTARRRTACRSAGAGDDVYAAVAGQPGAAPLPR